ncbi:MAG: glycoside hydrolase family 5 protein [Lachnospiraceae bacterium]|nr:glycoside hydrolase family 5 protein [Lachnospiraceae bacterium]
MSTETDNQEDKKQEVKESVSSENITVRTEEAIENITDETTDKNNTETTDKDITGGTETEKDETENSEPKEIVHEDDDVQGLTGALAFVRKLRIGWNLGNTMDANNSAKSGANLDLETAWCGARTTPEMIDTLKSAGFKSIRIPVSWHNHVDKDFNIEKPWLDRVKEIVDYVIERDMYCTINIHHDNSKEYFYPTSEYLEQSKNYVRKIWEQVGETFKDYDDHLIFEALNEPRLVGTSNEWSLSDNEMCHDAVRCINELNQLFVDTVRAQGSNNAERYLLVPAYAAQWNAAISDEFVLPADTADNKILVEVHAYSPYNFALSSPTDSNSTDMFNSLDNGSTAEINNLMLKLKLKFIDKGIGVVIDEFGARDKGGNLEARTDYAGYYVKKAREFGITCFWWDNNVFFGSGERFGIFDRKANTIRYPEIVQALVDNSKSD